MLKFYFLQLAIFAFLSTTFAFPVPFQSGELAVRVSKIGVFFCNNKFELKSNTYRDNAIAGQRPGVVRGEPGVSNPKDKFRYLDGPEMSKYLSDEDGILQTAKEAKGKGASKEPTRNEADHIVEAQYIKHIVENVILTTQNARAIFCRRLQLESEIYKGLLDAINVIDNIAFLDKDINNMKLQYTKYLLRSSLSSITPFPTWTHRKTNSVAKDDLPEVMAERVRALADYYPRIMGNQINVIAAVYDSLKATTDSAKFEMADRKFVLEQVWRDTSKLGNHLRGQVEQMMASGAIGPDSQVADWAYPDPNWASSPPIDQGLCARGMLSGLDRRCAVLEAPRLDRGALVYSAAALTSLFGDLNNDDLYEDDKQEPPVDAPTLTITEPMPSSLTVHNLFPTPPSFTITVGPEIFNDAPSSGVTPLSSIPASTPVQTSSPIPTQDLGLSISTAPVPNDAPTSSPPPAILPTSTTTSSQGPLSSIAQVTFSPPPPSSRLSVSLPHPLLPPLPPTDSPAPTSAPT